MKDPVEDNRATRVGRNEPCPCGSGKKYKKCHLGLHEAALAPRTQKVIKHFREVMEEQRKLEQAGIYMNYVKPVLFQGKKFWALGDRVSYTDNPDETFHDFILRVLLRELGREWWDEQQAMALEERHFIAQCYAALDDWKRRSAEGAIQVRPGVWEIEQDGLSRYLLSLAFDVASLLRDVNLPDHLMKRLRDRNQYQGARYELAIGALFARIDCGIRFLDSETPATKHPEFEALFRPTSELVAVEVKSRHRPGVLHQPGTFDSERAARGDVRRLLHEALKQDPGDKAFIVFIDLNSPPTPGVDLIDKRWFGELRNLIDKYRTPTAHDPDPLTLLGVTNFSYHYRSAKRGHPLGPLGVQGHARCDGPGAGDPDFRGSRRLAPARGCRRPAGSQSWIGLRPAPSPTSRCRRPAPARPAGRRSRRSRRSVRR